MAGTFTLLGCRGCGSVIVEAALRIADLPYDYEEVDYEQPGPTRDRLLALNPLGQVPTLLLPDGSIMTESGAIIMMINDRVPAAGLVPPHDSPERVDFLRWLFFLVAAIYPTFTYGDDPRKWLPGVLDPMPLKQSTNQHREFLWRQVESSISPDPWFLGERFSALDLYLAAMTHWRPRQEWFRRECPKLFAVAETAENLPPLASLFRDRFD